MKTLGFEIELLSDAVLSASGATAGGHRCLDYLPGAVLLGAAAKRLYASLGAKAFDAFHSGKVRFLPGYPLVEGGMALPTPLSFHREKAGPTADLLNLARPAANRMLRPELPGKPFISHRGALLVPGKRVALKTAIQAGKTQAAEGQLFTVEALAAGARFLAHVQLDEDLPAELGQAIHKALLEGKLGLGRSRSAEFGWAEARTATPWAAPAPAPVGDGRQILLYCLTDLALLDPRTGQPTLDPTAACLGVEGLELDREHTFLRIRRYSPINSRRRRPDLEHQVILQGSVLGFRVLAGGPEARELQRRLEGGVGAYRQEGLGQLLVDPPFLADRKPVFAARRPEEAATARPPLLADELLDWARAGGQAAARREKAFVLASAWNLEMRPYLKGRGPGRAQWGMLRERAALAMDGKALLDELFRTKPVTEGKQQPKAGQDAGLLRRGARAEAWKARYKGITAVDRLEQLLRDEGCPLELCRDALMLLAARMQKLGAGKEERR
ncbi:MAG TPA: hypothetical protein PK668_20875 [Myxococcota bacterium]|nr:hypothetical protein [Myxococcota bacterium]HRY96634.1 hypothetical protein [Myxococcota bacterium]